MKSAYFTIHLGKNPLPQNGCRLKSVFFYKHRFHILHFPNSTGLFTKLTGHRYTKYRFSPDIGFEPLKIQTKSYTLPDAKAMARCRQSNGLLCSKPSGPCTHGHFNEPMWCVALGPLHTRDWEPVTIFTSSTLIGGQGRAGPSSLHTMLEGPTEYVNARWM
jgi:hypothetical protein